ncbi:MAG: response regulator [Myxococcales bacterium]|nr:response regulator [Myxococcales bacterium]
MRSLRTKLILYISLLVASLVGVAGFVEVRKRSGELYTELREGAENFSAVSANTVLERASTLYYQPDQFPVLESGVRQVMSRHRALTRVQVVEALFGVVLFDSKEFDEGYYGFKRQARVFDEPKMLADVELNKLVSREKGDSYRVVIPLFIGKEIADPRDVNRAVVFDFSAKLIEKQLADMRLRYGLQALLFVLIGVALAALESQAITRPLRGLTEGVRRIGQGELEHRVEIKSRDELGMLGESFNAMAGSLKQSRDDLVKAMGQLEQQNVELRELDRVKDQFLANTSHELRTPINGILGLIGAVVDGADGPLNPKQAAHLKMVKDSAERLKHLITNILDFSKLKAGKEKFDLVSFKLSDLAGQISALGEGLLRGKPVTLAVELPPSLPPVQGDPERTLQVLTNLLGNAAKFTAKGHVRVYGQVQAGEMIVAVEDTGPGIPLDARRYLFQEFRQVDGSASRQFEGTGLGLAICKQLVNQMGGKIDFQSEVEKGTVFYFSMQLGAGDTVQTVTGTQPQGTVLTFGPETKVTVLAEGPSGVIGGTGKAAKDVDLTKLQGGGETIAVVDDEPANVESLKLLLSQNGYKVLPFTDPTKAVAALEQQKAHMVLCDVRMPQMTGIELCRKIRATPNLSRLPVFLVTAQAKTAADLHAATEAGVDGYVLKPFEPAELLARIHQVVKPKAQAVQRGSGQRVLVVDDREAAAQGLAIHLEGWGYKPIVSLTHEKLIELCAREKPDVAIIDVRMGPVTGFELCQQLRSDARFGQIPVLLVSGLPQQADRAQSREVGAQDYLVKPFAVEDLMGKVAFHLKRSASKLTRGNGEKILVVDDLQVNVEALAAQLEHRGFKPLRALSGEEALKLARAERPQVVVSDVMMPGMTGYDLCRELVADPDTGHPPVILLTAKSGTLQDKLLGFNAGAIDYVIKPFEPEELIARLSRLLTRMPAAKSVSHTQVTRVVEPIADAAATASSLEVRGSGELVLCVDDNPINLEVLKTHLEAVNYRTLLAKDGMDALEKLDNTKERIELILLDVMMPRMTGFEFLERVKETRHKEIPVVIVSAKDRPEDSLQGYRHGVVDYVTKPFNPSLVAAKVAAIISLRRAQAALSTINSELNVARLVQQASFPQPILDLSGYSMRGLIQCADTSGGDWYGYFVSPGKDRVTLLAGDVTGHGISAALVALAVSSVKTTVELVEGMLDTSRSRAAVLESLKERVSPEVHAGFTRLMQVPHSPQAFAALVNEVFCQSRSFLKMTAFVMNLDLRAGELHYTLAGGPKPLLLRRSQKGPGFEVASLTAGPSSVLGTDRQAKYTEQKISLSPGDSVLIYSDGVTEAENAQNQQYGARRLAQSLARMVASGKVPEALFLRDGVLQDLFKFTGDMPLKDDVTAVVLQRTP